MNINKLIELKQKEMEAIVNIPTESLDDAMDVLDEYGRKKNELVNLIKQKHKVVNI